jgi:hypothetical protein
MQGIIFKELQRYVSKSFGLPAWYGLLKGAALDQQLYLPTQHYPDGHLTALASGIAGLRGQPVPDTLEDFGAFLVPNLLLVYGSMIQPRWRTLDLLEHTGRTMHRVARHAGYAATPPWLRCTRTGPGEVVLHCHSERDLSSLGVGIIRGLARYYGESVRITRHQHPDRPAECVIVVERVEKLEG